MKKHLALLLASVIILTAVFTMVSCKKEEEPTTFITTDGEEIPIIDTGDIENTDPDHSAPGSSYMYVRTTLTLANDPVFADGKLTLNFNESATFNQNSECYIGIESVYEAESIKAKPDMAASVDMYNGNGAHTGIVLVAEDEILPGTYNFFVSIGTYVVETFEYTVE